MTTSDLILGIETSCDETAAAVVEAGRIVHSSVVSSQVDIHARFGGVVPEIAGRAHLEQIVPVVTEALRTAGLDNTGHRIDARPADDDEGARDIGLRAVAATVGPGLVGSLLVGVSHAKALALAFGVPFVGVNHLEGHLYAALLEEPELSFPVVVLLVSGGHTLLIAIRGPGQYEVLGSTIDDAAGEAFDKVARFLDLGYPGGPAIEQAARSGDPLAIDFPRPLLDGSCNFSFSGLKTAVIQHVRSHPDVRSEDVAAAFQRAVTDVLVAKASAAAAMIDARGICLAGGVAANGPLREEMTKVGAEKGLSVHLPSRAMCTDNAAMIAAAGWFQLEACGPTSLAVGAFPSLRLGRMI